MWLFSQLTESAEDPYWDVGDLNLGPEVRFRPGDEVLAGEPKAGSGSAGEQYLAGFVSANRVVERQRGLGIHHLANRFDPVLGEDRHRHLDPGLRRVAKLTGVDQLANGRLVLRRRHGNKRNFVGALAHRLQQLATARHLVEEDEQGLCLGSLAHVEPTTVGSGFSGDSTDSPAMIAWRAPGTPNS